MMMMMMMEETKKGVKSTADTNGIFAHIKRRTGIARTNDNNSKKWIAFSMARMEKHTFKCEREARAIVKCEKILSMHEATTKKLAKTQIAELSGVCVCVRISFTYHKKIYSLTMMGHTLMPIH